ncbi:MAG: class I adenylate-forming enzyme family protein [Actinomycetota bacterium]
MKSQRPPVSIPDEPLTFPLRRAAGKFPDKIAVITPEAERKEHTYRWLEDASSRLAASLAGLGVSPGDRVGLWLKNGVEYILSFYGILKAGGVIVPMSTHYGEREVLHQLNVTGAIGIVSSDDRYVRAAGLSEARAGLRFRIADGEGAAPPGTVRFAGLLRGNDLLDRSIGIDPAETLAVLPFSSGTTGLPKGVMLTHTNLLSNLYQICQAHEVREGDLFMNQLPFFHIYGMTVLMGSSILAGATQVLASRFRPVDEFLALFERYRPTLFLTVPLILQEFCHHPKVPGMDWSRMRYVNTGGAPMSPELQERFRQLTGVTVIQGYGLTESSPTTHVVPLDRIRVGTIGTPISLTEDRIADPETGRELPPGEVGELWVRGPQVMKGYYQDPEATARTLVDGWLRTGDLARRDEEGYVVIVDRLKELIKTNGFQVAPAEIEHILVGHPDVRDAAVIGVQHPDHGEVPVAFVVRKEGAAVTGEELIDFAAKGLAKYKRLSRVKFVEAIPRSASGKILRRVLKESPPVPKQV